jgi:ribonuclease HI
MEILDASNLMDRAESVGEQARMAQLYPSGSAGSALLAVDLLEIEPGGSTALLQHVEEQVLFVLSGSGEVRGSNVVAALVRADSLVYVAPREAHTLKNTGPDRLRVLISTPLLARSDRALGLKSVQAAGSEPVVDSRPDQTRPEPSRPQSQPAARLREVPPAEDEAPKPDISALMKRGSDIAAGPRPERRKAEPEPEPEPEPEAVMGQTDDGASDEDTEEEHREMMELAVVFDGGSRGNPGQGYGSYLVQSPGRKPVIKRVEFGDNYTNNQAEYDTLIASLEYIIERLTATNRTPAQVALDIKSDSDLLVNQLQGNYKVKDAGLRQRHTKAMDLLEQFGGWLITWHPREESVRLLGH